jgi:hypothetical protein
MYQWFHDFFYDKETFALTITLTTLMVLLCLAFWFYGPDGGIMAKECLR